MKNNLRRLLELLLRENETNSGIARKLDVHRDTVRRMRTKLALANLSDEEALALSEDQLKSVFGRASTKNSRFIIPDFDELIQELKKPAKNKSHLYAKYLEQVELQVGDRLRPMGRSKFFDELRERQKARGLEFRHYHRPAASMQFDFSGKKPFYIDSNGERVFVDLAVSILPYSNFIFAVALRSQTLKDSVNALVCTLEYFRSVPYDAVFDNFKAAVTTPRTTTKRAVINRHFKAALDHYSIFPDPARGAHPRDKGAGENAVKIVESDFIGSERYLGCSSLYELNVRLREVVDELNDRPMPTYQGRSRREIFMTEEYPCMRALPATKYEYGEWREGITVPLHYHVRVDDTEYSVPFRYAGRKVNIKVSSETVEVHTNDMLVAVHAIAPVGTRRATLPEHLPDNHLAMQGADHESVLERARRLGSVVQEFVTKHLEIHSNGKAALDMCRQFERKMRHYGSIAFFDAVREAIDREQINASAVYTLLDRPRGFTKIDDIAASPPPSGNVRGPDYYNDGEEK